MRKIIILSIIVLVVAGGAGFALYKHSHPATPKTKQISEKELMASVSGPVRVQYAASQAEAKKLNSIDVRTRKGFNDLIEINNTPL